MTTQAKLVSLLALAATIVPSLLFFAGVIGHDTVKWTALAGTFAWFIATPLWMGRSAKKIPGEVIP